MINNVQISGLHRRLSEKERSYVLKKIGNLERFIPRHARQSTFVDVKLKQSRSKDKQFYETEVIMKLPKATITVHKKALSMLAAIDSSEQNLKNQLKRYKDLHIVSRTRRHTMARFKKPWREATIIN